MIIDHYRARIRAQPVHALLDDAVALAQLFDPDQITIVTVAVLAHRNVEIDLVIGRVGLLLAQIPSKAGAADHGASEAELQGAFRRHHADADGALLPDAVVGEQGLVLVDVARKALGEVLDEVQQRAAAGGVLALHVLLAVVLGGNLWIAWHPVGQIAVNPARAIVARMKTRTGDRLVAVHQILALAEAVQEHGHGTHVQGVGAEPEQMIEDARDLVEQGTDPLGALRRLDAEQLLDGTHIAVLVTHHGHVIEPVHVTDALVEWLGLGELLGAAVQQPDVGIGAVDHLAVHLQHQTQDPVGRRVLRAEIQCVVADLRHRGRPWTRRALSRSGCRRGSRGAPGYAARYSPARRPRAPPPDRSASPHGR